MHILEEHRSPDGLLRFLVCRSGDGDISLGFDSFTWHTHADILASLSGLSENVAVKQFVDDVLSSRAIIAVARVDGNIRDVWVTDTPSPDKYKPDNETIEFRYWDGRSAV
jgi:hypothetical protein